MCRNEDAALRRFGVQGEDAGIGYIRTGRRFFDDPALEQALLGRVRNAASAAGLWEPLQSDWLLLDCELMPWSAKAQALLQNQYAAVGAAERGSAWRRPSQVWSVPWRAAHPSPCCSKRCVRAGRWSGSTLTPIAAIAGR